MFIELVTTLLLFYILFCWPRGMWDPSSLNKDQTCSPCIGSGSLNHWTAGEVPTAFFSSCIPIYSLLTPGQASWFSQNPPSARPPSPAAAPLTDLTSPAFCKRQHQGAGLLEPGALGLFLTLKLLPVPCLHIYSHNICFPWPLFA